jgi:indolepyruvate ferredoxin oxidoreductase beta subunit
MSPHAVSLLICALGGEGGGVLSEWLVEAALLAGYPVQSTSIPGVAQRTGATTYYVEIFPVPSAQLGSKKPILSLYPVPGALDLLVSSELLETVRQVQNGMAHPKVTRVLSSSSRTLTTNERMQMADGRLGQDELEGVIASHSLEHQIFDMTALASSCGTVVSAVMFGAVAASGVLPFGREFCEAAIKAQGKGTDKSLRGFSEAFDTVKRIRAGGLVTPRAVALEAPDLQAPSPVANALLSRFPQSLQHIVSLGWARAVEYQDGRYGELYLERVQQVMKAEQRALAAAGRDVDAELPATAECARYLALWMAFDDIVRVAELKARSSRQARVRREVRAKDTELVRLYDFFKPGVPEIAGLLPPALAQRLMRYDLRRQKAGKDPLAFPIQVSSSRLFGLLMLRSLAGLKWMRRFGLRYRDEHQAIEVWLGAIQEGLLQSLALGFELAACGRLIKGYGATNERGKHNLMHLVTELGHLPGASAESRARAIADARVAALQDDAGVALDRTLRQQGAKPRPVKAVPIRFQRRAAQNELVVEQVKRRA